MEANTNTKKRKSGKKSTWKSGARFEDTVTLRVPKAIRDEVLRLAHLVDEGEQLEVVSD
jgi:hypothetical protein